MYKVKRILRASKVTRNIKIQLKITTIYYDSITVHHLEGSPDTRIVGMFLF